MNESTLEQRGRLYWFFHNTRKALGAFFKRHQILFISIVLIILAGLFIYRASFHPLILGIRKHLFVLIVLIVFVLLVRWQLRKGTWKRKLTTGIISLLIALILVYGGMQVHGYIALYYRYMTLSVTTLDKLPLSDHERIQPLNSVFSLAHEAMSESESPMLPNFVRVGDEYKWTIAIEPAYPISRMLEGISEIFSVSGTTPSPNFSKQNRVPVRFEVGENLLFGRNTHIAVIRRFGPWRYLNYEPSDITYIQDENGEWIQVVSLIRWKGVFFPRPEFGGVNIIRQQRSTISSTVIRTFGGAGEWIRPEEVGKKRFLKGQNILPYAVSRYVASSFRFQSGFLAPFPGYHEGDIRIPDLPDDLNDQPFTAFFKRAGEFEGMLYHYFALEPYDPDKQGLNTSLFVPADGTPPVYVYKHHQKAGSLTGVSAISAKVMESKKNYDWTRNRPVEHRPFIKEINGETKFFWLTTVVTFKEGEGDRRFIAGTIPDVILTDAAYNTPIWVDPLSPDTWVAQIEKEMAGIWESK